MQDGFTEIKEGMTRLLVPSSSLTEAVPPKNPAFFNPSARLTRDFSILAYRAFAPEMRGEKTFADSFTGVGARALRVAVEVPEIRQIYGNDANPLAIEAAKKSAELNSVATKCQFVVTEVCKFLTDNGRFSIVDLDPFGTPARHIDCVLRSVLDGGMISITATDTAVLCGVYPEVCLRRYYGRPLNNRYCNETAIRLLLSLIALTASRLELSVIPLFAHADMHYLRVYARVSVSSSEANKVYDSIGYIFHCFNCGNRLASREYENKGCELCGKNLSVGGQLWSAKLYDKEFLKRMAEGDPGKQCKKILDASLDEIDDIPFYFRADEISAKLKTNPRTIPEIVEMLRNAGYRASRTGLNTAAFKTDAKMDQIQEVLRSTA